MTVHVEIADEQRWRPIDAALSQRMIQVLQAIARDHGFASGEISIAVLDDEAIHQMNREYLDHDWPTDVITFPFHTTDGHLEGEIVVSRETADRQANELPWSADDELLLYVIHGGLHLVGFEDHDDRARQAMRGAERDYLLRMNVPHAETHQ